MHGRMELNAVRHAMQIQDAPGDNAGKKLRLTHLYQPVLKGARIQPPTYACTWRAYQSRRSLHVCTHAVHIRAFAVVRGDDGGTRDRVLSTLCAARVKSLLAFKCYEHRSRDYRNRGIYFLRFWILDKWMIKFFGNSVSFFSIRTLLLSNFFSSFIEVASKKWVEEKLWI